MRRAYLLVGVGALLLAACNSESPVAPGAIEGESDLAPLYLASADAGIPGEYLVILRPDAVMAAAAVAALAEAEPRREFVNVQRGFLATLSPSQVTELRRSVSVAWIEQNQVVRAGATQPISGANRPWGLDRIDQPNLPYDEIYHYGRSGFEITAYVFDTGIRATHSEFRNGGPYGVTRAQNVFDAFGGDGSDCHGHGTHVAGIIGSNTFGVAKKVQLRGLRVLDCSGGGTTATIIAGIDWLIDNFTAPAVANMSLGTTGLSKSINVWTDALAAAGVFVSVAAGNEDDYSCTASPASAVGAFTVAASDSLDNRASFSNWGRCADLYAPGVAIISTWYTGHFDAAMLNGTSMAAPFVAGMAALMKSRFGDLDSDVIGRRLVNASVADVIQGNDGAVYQYGTPNRLLQKAY